MTTSFQIFLNTRRLCRQRKVLEELTMKISWMLLSVGITIDEQIDNTVQQFLAEEDILSVPLLTRVLMLDGRDESYLLLYCYEDDQDDWHFRIRLFLEDKEIINKSFFYWELAEIDQALKDQGIIISVPKDNTSIYMEKVLRKLNYKAHLIT